MFNISDNSKEFISLGNFGQSFSIVVTSWVLVIVMFDLCQDQDRFGLVTCYMLCTGYIVPLTSHGEHDGHLAGTNGKVFQILFVSTSVNSMSVLLA